jgi:Flp pilus assembly pilin Flp
MNTILLKVYVRVQDLATREEGQDMVEYFLMTSLLAFSWIAGTKSAAAAMNSAFTGLSTTLASYIS